MQIFNSPFKSTQSWTSQGAIINYGIGISTETFQQIPLMVSGLSFSYTQQATPVFPLNTDGNGNATKINIKGAPQGQLQLQSIYCPVAKNIDDFLEKASRSCVGEAEQLIVTIRPFGDIKCGNESVTDAPVITLTGVELATIGFSIASGAVTLVNMPLSFSFTNMDID